LGDNPFRAAYVLRHVTDITRKSHVFWPRGKVYKQVGPRIAACEHVQPEFDPGLLPGSAKNILVENLHEFLIAEGIWRAEQPGKLCGEEETRRNLAKPIHSQAIFQMLRIGIDTSSTTLLFRSW